MSNLSREQPYNPMEHFGSHYLDTVETLMMVFVGKVRNDGEKHVLAWMGPNLDRAWCRHRNSCVNCLLRLLLILTYPKVD